MQKDAQFEVAKINHSVDVRCIQYHHNRTGIASGTLMSERAVNRRTEAMSDTIKTVVVVAEPGRIRDSLEALLQTIPQLELVIKAADGSTVHELVVEYNPDLILLVTPASNELTAKLLDYLKEVRRTPCLLLTNSIHQLEQAKAAGADDVLLTGFPTSELFESVGSLLSS